MPSAGDEILNLIEKKHVTPKPRWRFFLRDYTVWILSLFFLVLSSLATSTSLFIFTSNDWNVYRYLGRGFLKDVLISIPYFWILVFGVLIVIAYYSFAHTKYGYRHSILRVLLGSISCGLILGTALFFIGIDSEIHDVLSKNIPVYNNLIYYKEDVWNNPQKGLLGGEVAEIKNEDEFIIKDFSGTAWRILGANDIEWPDDLALQEGLKLKLIGRYLTDHIFYVNAVRRW